MVPLPKRRHSTRRQGKRQAAISLNIPILRKCTNCGTSGLAHRVCRKCGHYNGKQIAKTKSARPAKTA